ncbi:hypothetical protein C8R45DRAFT_946720 [Mycena sanguinolenta]|nr:hypothetical protein C8R45DRAFT_946720 [Mycena sanguinolenta]
MYGSYSPTRRNPHDRLHSTIPSLPTNREPSGPGEVRGRMSTVVAIAQHTFPRIRAIISAAQVDVDDWAFAGKQRSQCYPSNSNLSADGGPNQEKDARSKEPRTCKFSSQSRTGGDRHMS